MLIVLGVDKVGALVLIAHSADLVVPEVAPHLAPRQDEPAVVFHLFQRRKVVALFGNVIVRYHNGKLRFGREKRRKLFELIVCIAHMCAALLEYHPVLTVEIVHRLSLRVIVVVRVQPGHELIEPVI